MGKDFLPKKVWDGVVSTLVPCLPVGRKGHDMNEISFARILLVTGCPGSPAL